MRPEIIATYVDRTASPEERSRVEAHLRLCSECRHELVTVSRVVRSRRRRRALFVAVPVAAAAVFALICLGMPEGTSTPSAEGVVMRAESGEGTERFEIVAPIDLDSIVATSLEFMWRSVAAAAYYKLTLTDADGDVLWTESTADTNMTFPDSVGVSVGATYFWYVDALLERGQSATTGVSSFVIAR